MKLEVNCAYVNHLGAFAREIIAIENGQVSYRDFLLSDGQPMSSFRKCSRATFRNWAARLCTASEVAMFRRDDTPHDDQLLLSILQQR